MAMNITCIMIVRVPTENGVNMLTVYGTPEIGDVPRSAAIENATPSAITHRPATSVSTLCTICSFLMILLYNYPGLEYQ